LANVSTVSIDNVENMSFFFSNSMLIDELDFKAEKNLINPYENNQIAENANKKSEYLYIKLSKKIEIPIIPKNIKIVSEIEQYNEVAKTCCLIIPCLRTNIFWAPIAIINEEPSKNPVIIDSITLIIFCLVPWTEKVLNFEAYYIRL